MDSDIPVHFKMYFCAEPACIRNAAPATFVERIWRDVISVAVGIENERRIFADRVQKIYAEMRQHIRALNYFHAIACRDHAPRYLFEESGINFWYECIDADCSARVRALLSGKHS